ncbi:hypothetical protein HZB74_01520 [Candidatus Saccharibacteria bacterium]|nr:hypothetical protein [Candidatus Saccharibacteria bacterium]
MAKQSQNRKKVEKTDNIFRYLLRWSGLELTDKRWLRNTLIGLLIFVMVGVGAMYGIAKWYMAKHADEPLVYGATFIPKYAKSFGLEPREVLHEVIDDLGIKRLRFVSYWNEHERVPGEYNFDELDWQFEAANQSGAKVSLAIGLRQPRWPECHMPGWAEEMPKDEWSKHLNAYITKVVERYKDNPALESYQLENEYFLSVFGDCPDHSKERLVNEFNLVKSLDPSKPLIVTRSNNAVPSWPIGEPRSDINGASIYKRVWDATVTKRYFEYPVPAWFYGFLAGGAELTTNRNTFIHELQTEAWLPPGKRMNDLATIPEQNKSLSPDQLRNRMLYAEATGAKTIDLWGVEWWYWRKQAANDPGLWQTAKEVIADSKN